MDYKYLNAISGPEDALKMNRITPEQIFEDVAKLL